MLALPLALGACGDREPAQVAAARPAYDADSAARGLLPPELADMLAVDSLLNAAWLARHEGRCRVDTLAQLGHLRRRIDAPLELGTSVTVFTRTTRQGEIRRVEILRTAAGRAPVAAASWDAATSRTVLTEWPQRAPGPIRKTTIADPDAPLPRSLRYVGRLANAIECEGEG